MSWAYFSSTLTNRRPGAGTRPAEPDAPVLVAQWDLNDNVDLTAGAGPNGTAVGEPSFATIGALDDGESVTVADAALTEVAGSTGVWTGAASWPLFVAGDRFEITDHSVASNNGLWAATGTPTTSNVPATKLTGGTPTEAIAQSVGVHPGASMYGGYWSIPSGNASLALTNFPRGMVISYYVWLETLPVGAGRVQTFAGGNSSAAGHCALLEILASGARGYLVDDANQINWWNGTAGSAIPGLTINAGQVYHVVTSFGELGGQLWVNKVPVATIGATNLPTNAVAKFLKSWITGAPQFVMPGAMRKLSFWNGQGSQTFVDAFPNARTPGTSAVATEYVTTLEAHGWADGNTVEQNSDALRTALANASTNASSSVTGRGVVELSPAKVYVVRPNGDANGSQDQHLGAIDITNSLQNVEIRTRGKPLLGSASQATLQMESWSGKTGKHNCSVISLHSARNVVIESVKIDGNKTTVGGAAGLSTVISYANADNGGLSCIAIQGCDGVTIRNVDAFGGLTDSLKLDKEHHATEAGYINGDLVRNLLVEDCDFHHSRRMALAVIAAGDPAGTYNQVVFRRAKFRFAGDDGELPGEAPGSCVDFEPNNSGDKVDGLTFEDCQAENAQGSTYELGSPISKTAGRGWMFDSRSGHVSTKMQFINCAATGNNVGSEGRAFHMFGRGGGSFDDWLIEGFVASGNTSNLINFLGDSGQTPHWTNFTIIDANVSAIFFNSNLPASGHGVTIWRGNFNPTITTNSKTTITINNGFPGSEGETGVTAIAPDTDINPKGSRYAPPGWIGRSGMVVALSGRTSAPMDVWSDPRRVASGVKANAQYEFRAAGGGTFPGGTWAKNGAGDLVFTSNGDTGVKSGEYRMRGAMGANFDAWSDWTPIRIDAVARPSGTLFDIEAQTGTDTQKIQKAINAANSAGGGVVYSSLGLAKQYIIDEQVDYKRPGIHLFDINAKRVSAAYIGGSASSPSSYTGLHRRGDRMFTTALSQGPWSGVTTATHVVNCLFDGNSFDQPIANYSGGSPNPPAGSIPNGPPGLPVNGGYGFPGEPPGSDGFNLQQQHIMAFINSNGAVGPNVFIRGCSFIHSAGDAHTFNSRFTVVAEYNDYHANLRGDMVTVRDGNNWTLRRCYGDARSQRADRPFLSGEAGTPAASWDTVRFVGGGVDNEPEGHAFPTVATIERCFIESDLDFRTASDGSATITLTDVRSRLPQFPQMYWSATLNEVATHTRCTCHVHKEGGAGGTLAGTPVNPRGRTTGGRQIYNDCDWFMGSETQSWPQHGKRIRFVNGSQCGWLFRVDSGATGFQIQYISNRFWALKPPGVNLGLLYAFWAISSLNGLSAQGTNPHIILSGHFTFDSGFAQFPFRGNGGTIRILAGTTFQHADFPGASTFWSNFTTVQDQR